MNNEDEIKKERMEILSNLKIEAELKQLSNKDISEKTGLIESNINRIFMGKFSPTLDIFIAIKNAIFNTKRT